MEAWKSHVKNLRNFTNGTLPAVLSLLHLSLLNFRVTILPPFFSFFSLIYLITWTRWNFVKHTCKCTNRWKRPSCPTESQRSSLSFFSLLSTWKKTNETISNAKRGIFVNCVKNVLRIRFTVRKLAGNTLRKFSLFQVGERKKIILVFLHSCVCVYPCCYIDRVENRVIISIFIRNLFTLRYS